VAGILASSKQKLVSPCRVLVSDISATWTLAVGRDSVQFRQHNKKHRKGRNQYTWTPIFGAREKRRSNTSCVSTNLLINYTDARGLILSTWTPSGLPSPGVPHTRWTLVPPTNCPLVSARTAILRTSGVTSKKFCLAARLLCGHAWQLARGVGGELHCQHQQPELRNRDSRRLGQTAKRASGQQLRTRALHAPPRSCAKAGKRDQQISPPPVAPSFASI